MARKNTRIIAFIIALIGVALVVSIAHKEGIRRRPLPVPGRMSRSDARPIDQGPAVKETGQQLPLQPSGSSGEPAPGAGQEAAGPEAHDAGEKTELPRIYGYVFRKSNKKPVRGAVIELTSGNFKETISTDDSGEFSFVNTGGGDYTLFLIADNAASVDIERIHVSEGKSVRRDFLISSGAMVTGRVTDSEYKEPMAEATVTLRLRRRKKEPVTLKVYTDENGHFAIDEIFQEGIYRLEAIYEGYARDSRRIAIEDGEYVYLENFELSPGADISGSVSNEAGNPVPGAGILISSPDEESLLSAPATAKTQENGMFLLENLPVESGLTLYVVHQDYAPIRIPDFDIPYEGIISNIDLVLTKGTTLKGMVKDSREVPVPRARIRIKNRTDEATPPFNKKVLSDDGGAYSIPGMPAGAFDITISAENFLRGKQEITIQPGKQEEALDIILRNGNMISGSVMDIDDIPVPGATVMATGKSFHRVLTDEGGDFSIEGLEDNKCVLHASAEGYSSDSMVVEPAGQKKVIFTLLRSEGSGKGNIRGTIKSAVAEVAPRITLKLFRVIRENMKIPYRPKKKMTLDRFGAFSISDIPAGRYMIHADGYGFAPTRSEVITVRSDETIEGVVIEMEAPGSVSGYVYDSSTGSGLADAMVAVEGHSSPRNPRSKVEVEGEGQTAPDGHFAINDLPEGIHTITASREGFKPATIRNINVSGGEVTAGIKFRLLKVD